MNRNFLVAALVMALLAVPVAELQAQPNSMTVQGVLRTVAGDVVNGVYPMTFKFYAAENSLNALFEADLAQVESENGVYAAVIDFGNDEFVSDQDSLWLGVTVEDGAEFPRIPLNSVPFAISAANVNCTGCIAADALDFDPVTQEELTGGDLTVDGVVSATAFIGDGSGLTNIPLPVGTCSDGWFVKGLAEDGALLCEKAADAVQTVDGLVGGTIAGDVIVDGELQVTGMAWVDGQEVCNQSGNCGETLAQLTCDAEQVAKWNGEMWECSDFALEFDPSTLPADGINEISNELIFNQFVDPFSSPNVPVQVLDNNPTGVSDEIDVPDVGIAQDLTVSINISNSDFATVKVLLYDPNNVEYTLYDKDGPGDQLGATYPKPQEPVEGDLTTWIGQNPQGIWRLQVIDTGFLNNTFDGQINSWSIKVHTLSTKKIQIKGDLYVDGTIHGPDGQYIPGNATVEGSIKVGNDTADCDADKAGTIRYDGEKMQWCDSKRWISFDKGATYRWAQWSTYDQNYGWMADNRAEMFGGVKPHDWTDGNARAYQMSSNSDVLRTLFTRKGPSIGTLKNALIMANQYKNYSSTDGRVTGALFRIRNNTAQNITWNAKWYTTAYSGWSERASIAINGSEVWQSGGSNLGAIHEQSHNITVPADRVSTVIFISTSSHPSGDYRANFMAFYDNCLALPDGLEFIDDLDYKENGWNN